MELSIYKMQLNDPAAPKRFVCPRFWTILVYPNSLLVYFQESSWQVFYW